MSDARRAVRSKEMLQMSEEVGRRGRRGNIYIGRRDKESNNGKKVIQSPPSLPQVLPSTEAHRPLVA